MVNMHIINSRMFCPVEKMFPTFPSQGSKIAKEEGEKRSLVLEAAE